MRGHRIILAGLVLLIDSVGAFGQIAPASDQAPAAPAGPYDHLVPVLGSQLWPAYLNWGDLPFKLSFNQSLGYNDNVLGLAQGQPLPLGTPARGDLFSTTTFGAATKFTLGNQQFFVEGNYGLTRYRLDSFDNTSNYSLDAGVNWNVSSHCSGRLIGAANQYQSPIEEQVLSGINTVNTLSVSETSKCQLTGYMSSILDSGLSSTRNSQAFDALNNYNSEYIRGGLEYSLSGLDSLQALTTYTKREFTERSNDLVTINTGLASNTDQFNYQLVYHRIVTPKITFDGSIGLAQTILASSGSGLVTPVYSISVLWQASPKVSFGAASGRSVGAPTSVIANAQISDTQSVSVQYSFSPKISVQAGVGRSESSGGGFELVFGQLVSIGTQTATTAYGKLGYQITPFVGATASYQYSDRHDQGFDTKENIFMLGLSYRPM